MSRLSDVFNNRPVFMPYFPVGYPDYDVSLDIIESLAKNGADIIEVGISFSDPLADGPIIQKATQIALEHGITVKKTLAAITELRNRNVTIPLILMGYFNPIMAYGLEKFINEARSAGVDGFIIPDLPQEEAGEFSNYLGELPLICMLAPSSTDERMEMIARNARGFIYLVSVMGVTGSRGSLPVGIESLINRVRSHTSTPICVGFGISSPEQARVMGSFADGVIVGSACVKTIGDSDTPILAAKNFAILYKNSMS
jgi:tryptophan synthase alpha chain